METAGAGDLGIDLGKTSCRVRASAAGRVFETAVAGAEGFAAGAAGLAQALNAIEAALSALPDDVLDRIGRIGVGAAGVDADREQARAFAETLAQRHRANVTVVSDALAAHAGALGGEPGTVLIAGTGSVAFHLSQDGELNRADGWGIWLGDLGSGRWIGQEGLRRVLQARDGLGYPTSLTQAVLAAAGPLDSLPRYVSGGDQPERVLASFAPAVLEHASIGDPVAAAIVDEAVEHLADTAAACTCPGKRLAVVGGLTSSAEFGARLTAALSARTLNAVPALDDAIAGALLICAHSDLPHERYAIRVRY